jgi:hypothetical protein
MLPGQPRRTPKTGVLRWWILLPRVKRVVVVGLGLVLLYAAARLVLEPPPQATIRVPHALTLGGCLG